MVSSAQNSGSPDIVSATRERYLEESTVSSGLIAPPAFSPLTHFWGSVILGSLVVVSLFVLSWYLMLGCHVGVAANGVLALGVGAAIWLAVTACIAFYAGGCASACVSRPVGPGWAKGLAVWALTIPLAMWLSQAGAAVFAGITLSRTNLLIVDNTLVSGVQFGFVWSVFIILGLGFIAALAGSTFAKSNAAVTATVR